MATRSTSKKVAPLTIVVPTNIAKIAKSSSTPSQAFNPGDVIPNRTLYNLLNVSVRNYRDATSLPSLMRHMSRAEGPLSAAIHNLVQVANCTHTITAFDAVTHEFSPEGTALAKSVVASMDTVYDYTKGFTTKKSMESLKAHMLREVAITGGLAAELVLSEAQLPDILQVVPVETIEMVAGSRGRVYPQQKIAGKNDPVKLDLPNFFLSLMQHDANSYYGFSMRDSAVKLIIYFEEFMEDIRRSVRQNGHTRTVLTMDVEKLLKIAPRDATQNVKKQKEYLDLLQAGVVQQLQNLSPEEAMVLFDTCKAENLQAGLGSKVDYTPLLSCLLGMYATALKAPPSALGMRLEGGSQALGNVESLIFLKTCSAVQTPVEEVMSRALTLGCRLFGSDIYVVFSFDPIDLRPDTELQAFYTMKQTQIIEKLSLGFITDEYAAHLLGTGPLPAGFKPLSGTMFTLNKGVDPNTSPGDTAMGRTLQPDKEVPRKGGGKSQ